MRTAVFTFLCGISFGMATMLLIQLVVKTVSDYKIVRKNKE